MERAVADAQRPEIRKSTLSRKVLLICLGLGSLVVLQGSLSLLTIYRIRTTISRLNLDTSSALYWEGKLKGAAQDQRIAIVFYLYSTTGTELSKYEDVVEKTEEDLRTIREKYPKFDPRDRQAIANTAIEQANFYQAWLEIKALKRAGKDKEAKDVYDTQLKQAELGRRKMDDYLSEIDQERGQRLTKDDLDMVSQQIPIVCSILFLTLVLVTGASFWFLRWIQRSTQQLEEQSKKLSTALESDQESSLAEGMNGFVLNPFSKSALLDALKRWLPVGDARAPATNRPVPSQIGECLPAIFDRASVMERLEGDDELIRIIIETFLEDAPLQIEQLKNLVKCGDAASAGRLAHSIKGAVPPI